MDPKLYLLLSSSVYGYYNVCCIGYLSTTGLSNWWNILVLISMIFSVIYFCVLYKVLNAISRRRSQIQFWSFTSIAIILVIVSSAPCFTPQQAGAVCDRIVQDIDSRVFSIIYFTSVLGYFILLIINMIIVKFRLMSSQEQFIEMV